jgi:hypothetical protein
MKHILTFIAATLLFVTTQAQTRKEKQVQNAVEQLRRAMIDGDSIKLTGLVSDKLSYGHSGGHIDDKTEFVHKLSSGKSDFVTMDLTEQTISMTGKTAIVRHTLTAKTNDSGKPGDVHLLVMLVWQKLGGRWILVARQAVKPS